MLSKWAEEEPPPRWVMPSLAVLALGAIAVGVSLDSEPPAQAGVTDATATTQELDLEKIDIVSPDLRADR